MDLFQGRNSSRGFTLIEVLIAFSLISVILVVTYRAFFLSHRASQEMDNTVLKLEEVRNCLDIMRREIEATYFDPKSRVENAFKIEDRDFYGQQASKITFSTFCSVRPGVAMVSYRAAQNGKKLTLFKDFPQFYAGEKDNISTEFLEGIESFTVEVPFQGEWIRTWDALENGGLPGQIRISIGASIGKRAITLTEVALPRAGKRL